MTLTVTMTVTMTVTITVTVTMTLTVTMTMTLTLSLTVTMTVTMTVTLTLTSQWPLLPDSFLTPWNWEQDFFGVDERTATDDNRPIGIRFDFFERSCFQGLLEPPIVSNPGRLFDDEFVFVNRNQFAGEVMRYGANEVIRPNLEGMRSRLFRSEHGRDFSRFANRQVVDLHTVLHWLK